MNKSNLLFTILISLSFVGCSQSKTQEIRVQILHNQEVYLDTALTEEPAEAKKIIEQLVSRYSSENIEIGNETLHGLYVFNVPEKDWKANKDKKQAPNEISKLNQIEINIDSLFDKFSNEMERQWKEFDMDKTKKDVKEGVEKFKENTKPEVQELKKEVKEMLEKMKTTRIVIIQKGDTISVH
jgi:gas vesicle protein